VTKINWNEVADELDICHLTKLVGKVKTLVLARTAYLNAIRSGALRHFLGQLVFTDAV